MLLGSQHSAFWLFLVRLLRKPLKVFCHRLMEMGEGSSCGKKLIPLWLNATDDYIIRSRFQAALWQRHHACWWQPALNQPIRWLVSGLISPTGAGLLWEENTVPWLISLGWNQQANKLIDVNKLIWAFNSRPTTFLRYCRKTISLSPKSIWISFLKESNILKCL